MIAALVATAWSVPLLANPAWLGAPAWSLSVPWIGFLAVWLVVQMKSRRSITWRSRWVISTTALPFVLFALMVTAYSTSALVVARVYLSQDSLDRLAAAASPSANDGDGTTRAGLFRVWNVEGPSLDGQVILYVKGGVFNEGVVVRSPAGEPTVYPDYDSVRHLFGPWWAMVETDPLS